MRGVHVRRNKNFLPSTVIWEAAQSSAQSIGLFEKTDVHWAGEDTVLRGEARDVIRGGGASDATPDDRDAKRCLRWS